jgi:competence protein ComEC
MNDFIEWLNDIPYVSFDGIQNSFGQTMVLFVCIAAACYWLLYKKKTAFFTALSALFVFIAIDSFDHYNARKQGKMIVYNIPQHSAIDFINGKQYAFAGDRSLSEDPFLSNFHLKPSRTLHRLKATENLDGFYASHPFFLFKGNRILIIDKSFRFASTAKIELDLVIVAHSPRLSMADLVAVFDCKQIIFDGSNAAWKIRQWKKECESLHLPNYSTTEKGAYVLNL